MGTDLRTTLKELENKLRGKTVILGMGNSLRGDDGFGSNLAKRIKDKINLKVLDGAAAPENFLGHVLKETPQAVLFIDAVDFGGCIGETKLLDFEDIKTSNFFLTHNTSVGLLFNFLHSNSQAEIFLLAIQPKSIDLAEKMSPQIEERLEELTLWFLEKYHN